MRRTSPDGCRDALVIVAKYPTPGHVKTRLGATIGLEHSARLYRAFLQDVSERFSRSARVDGYDLIWAAADATARMATILGADARIIPQRGDDFAARLYHICCDVAALGYTRTIILGSDSPQTPTETITQAFALLETNDVVLGPADDGGYYLAGVRNQPAPPDIFTGIIMSTPQVFAHTLERAHTLGLSVRRIAATYDIDTEADMLRLAHALDVTPSLAPRTHALLETLLAQVGGSEGGGSGAG